MPTPRYGNPPALQAKINSYFAQSQVPVEGAPSSVVAQTPAVAPPTAAPSSDQPAVIRYHPNRADRRAAKAKWEDHARKIRSVIGPARNETLEIWLPGLQLYSENTALRGDKMPGRRDRDNVAVQSAALNEAQIAFMTSGSEVWRFSVMVSLIILQHGRKRDIDPGNLFHKPLIDCLIARNGFGLGIINDDSARYVSRVTVGYGPRELTGVSVEIRPEEVAA